MRREPWTNPTSTLPPRWKGFTLVETLLAIAIIVVLMGSMFAFLSNVMGRSDRARQAMAGDRGLDVFFADVERSLATTFVGDREDAPGVRASGTSLRVLSRGTTIDAGLVTDVRGVEYRFEAGEVQGRKWGESAGEQAWETIAGDIGAVRVRCFDGREWTSAFDSFKAGRLPMAVEVAVWRGAGALPTASAPKADEKDAEQEPGEGTADGEPEAEMPRRAPDRVSVIAVPDAGGGG